MPFTSDPTPPASRLDWLQQARSVSNDPRERWLWALAQRRDNTDPQLANAEHYLWNAYYAGQGPLQAAGAFVTPYGYYMAKKLGLMSSRSPASLEQLQSGLMGAFEGVGVKTTP